MRIPHHILSTTSPSAAHLAGSCGPWFGALSAVVAGGEVVESALRTVPVPHHARLLRLGASPCPGRTRTLALATLLARGEVRESALHALPVPRLDVRAAAALPRGLTPNRPAIEVAVAPPVLVPPSSLVAASAQRQVAAASGHLRTGAVALAALLARREVEEAALVASPVGAEPALWHIPWDHPHATTRKVRPPPLALPALAPRPKVDVLAGGTLPVPGFARELSSLQFRRIVRRRDVHCSCVNALGVGLVAPIKSFLICGVHLRFALRRGGCHRRLTWARNRRNFPPLRYTVVVVLDFKILGLPGTRAGLALLLGARFVPVI